MEAIDVLYKNNVFDFGDIGFYYHSFSWFLQTVRPNHLDLIQEFRFTVTRFWSEQQMDTSYRNGIFPGIAALKSLQRMIFTFYVEVDNRNSLICGDPLWTVEHLKELASNCNVKVFAYVQVVYSLDIELPNAPFRGRYVGFGLPSTWYGLPYDERVLLNG